jgi:hypothetical protein
MYLNSVFTVLCFISCCTTIKAQLPVLDNSLINKLSYNANYTINPYDTTVYVLINYDSLVVSKNTNKISFAQVALESIEKKDSIYSMEVLNIGISSSELRNLRKTVLKKNACSYLGQKIYAYFTIIGDKAQPKVVWKEIQPSEYKIRSSYTINDLFLLSDRYKFTHLGCLAVGEWNFTPNRGRIKPILLKNGKYYITENRTLYEVYGTDAFPCAYKFGRLLGDGNVFNFMAQTVSQKDIDKEVKRLNTDKYCVKYKEVVGGDFLNQVFLRKGNTTTNIWDFFYIYAYYQRTDLQSDYDIYDLRLHPTAGILSIDYRFMKETLGLKKPYEIKSINGLSVEDYNSSIKNQ